MKKGEKYASLKNTKFGQKLIITGIVAFVAMTIIFTCILYPVRNRKSNDVAIRFVRNNEIIKSEIGEITKIIGFGLLELPNRSEEIARKLRNGEDLSNIIPAKEKDNSQFSLISDSYGSWQSGKLIGSKKTIQVSLYLRKREFGDYNSIYYTVNEAKYLDETENWKDIPIGWLENYNLLFK